MGDRGVEIGCKRWRGQERIQIDFVAEKMGKGDSVNTCKLHYF